MAPTELVRINGFAKSGCCSTGALHKAFSKSSKLPSCFSVHLKATVFLSRSERGLALDENPLINRRYYLAKPKNCLTFLWFLGVVNLCTASVFFGSGCTPFSSRMCPSHSTSVARNSHLSGWSDNFAACSRSKSLLTFSACSSKLGAKMIT